MLRFLFGFQIFIAILISFIVIFQNSSSDGIISNSNGAINHVSQNTFIGKSVMILIFIFMANSVILSRYSAHKLENDHRIIHSLESPIIQGDKLENTNNVPNME